MNFATLDQEDFEDLKVPHPLEEIIMYEGITGEQIEKHKKYIEYYKMRRRMHLKEQGIDEPEIEMVVITTGKEEKCESKPVVNVGNPLPEYRCTNDEIMEAAKDGIHSSDVLVAAKNGIPCPKYVKAIKLGIPHKSLIVFAKKGESIDALIKAIENGIKLNEISSAFNLGIPFSKYIEAIEIGVTHKNILYVGYNKLSLDEVIESKKAPKRRPGRPRKSETTTTPTSKAKAKSKDNNDELKQVVDGKVLLNATPMRKQGADPVEDVIETIKLGGGRIEENILPGFDKLNLNSENNSTTIEDPEEIKRIEDSFNDIKEIAEKNFRIQNTRFHLTYKTHIDIDTWVKWAQTDRNSVADNGQFGIGLQLDGYSIVHETGNTGYQHTHILIQNKKIFQSKKPSIFDFKIADGFMIHPNIKKVTTNEHMINILKYHKKQGTPVIFGNFNNLESIVEKVWGCETPQQLLKTLCTNARDASSLLAIYEHKPIVRPPPPEIEWHPWQKTILDKMGNKPNERNINWVWDPIGNTGKTFFSKYVGMYVENAHSYCVSNGRDISTIIKNTIERNEKIRCVTFNFSRSKKLDKSTYETLEQIKDGMMTAQKYNGGTIYFDSPHLYVFANFLPNIVHCSLDRWKIRAIAGNKFVQYIDTNKMSQWIDSYNNENRYSTSTNTINEYRKFATMHIEIILGNENNESNEGLEKTAQRYGINSFSSIGILDYVDDEDDKNNKNW
jgi:hypothetical protein